MTKTKTTLVTEPALLPEAAQSLRHELGEFMRQARQNAQPSLTQMQLSKKLGCSYSIVSNWENGIRQVLLAPLLAWAEILGISTDFEAGPLAIYKEAIASDEISKPNKGERIERDVCERLALLRDERRLSLREMATITGINYSHYARIEKGISNASVSQLRAVSKQLHVSYEYLIDGANKEDTVASLREQVGHLTRENELLENLRQLSGTRSTSLR